MEGREAKVKKEESLGARNEAQRSLARHLKQKVRLRSKKKCCPSERARSLRMTSLSKVEIERTFGRQGKAKEEGGGGEERQSDRKGGSAARGVRK